MNFSRAKILNFYILKQYAMALLLVVLSIFGLIYIINLVEFLRDKGQYQLSFGAGPKIVFFETFANLQIILPFAVLIASLIVFARMSKSSELVIIRAVGGSVWQFLSPMVLMVFTLGFFQIMVLNPIAYHLENAALDSRVKEGLKSEPLKIKESGLWLKDGYANLQPVIYAKTLRNVPGEGLHLEDMSIVVIDRNESFSKKIYAKSALLGKEVFHLNDVSVFNPGESVEKLETLDFRTTLTLDKIQKNLVSPTKNFSLWELPGYIRFLDEAGFSSLQYRVYFYSLLAFPFLLVAFLFLCAAFSLSPNQRTLNFLWRVVLSAVVGFMLYFCNQIVMAMGNSGTIPVWLATFGTPLIAVLIEVSLLLHIEDG